MAPQQAAAALVGDVEHQRREPARAQRRVDQALVDAVVGQQHRHDGRAAAGEALQQARAVAGRGARGDAHLDVVDAAGRHGGDAAQDLVAPRRRHVADRGADRDAGLQCPQGLHDARDAPRRQPAQRAGGGFLEVDEMRAGPGGLEGLVQVAHARQHPRHPAFSATGADARATASRSQPQASCSAGPAVLSMAICR